MLLKSIPYTIHRKRNELHSRSNVLCSTSLREDQQYLSVTLKDSGITSNKKACILNFESLSDMTVLLSKRPKVRMIYT